MTTFEVPFTSPSVASGELQKLYSGHDMHDRVGLYFGKAQQLMSMMDKEYNQQMNYTVTNTGYC